MLTRDAEIKTVILNILKDLNFPCFITIDGNGFLEKKEEEKAEIVFCFASVNTGIELTNGKNLMLIDGTSTRKSLEAFIGTISNEDFFDKWFRQHDRIADFRGSGFGPRRILNLVITLDPMYTPVTEIIQ